MHVRWYFSHKLCPQFRHLDVELSSWALFGIFLDVIKPSGDKKICLLGFFSLTFSLSSCYVEWKEKLFPQASSYEMAKKREIIAKTSLHWVTFRYLLSFSLFRETKDALLLAEASLEMLFYDGTKWTWKKKWTETTSSTRKTDKNESISKRLRD